MVEAAKTFSSTRFQTLVKVQIPQASADHSHRRQPDADDGDGDGGHLLDDRRIRPLGMEVLISTSTASRIGAVCRSPA